MSELVAPPLVAEQVVGGYRKVMLPEYNRRSNQTLDATVPGSLVGKLVVGGCRKVMRPECNRRSNQKLAGFEREVKRGNMYLETVVVPPAVAALVEHPGSILRSRKSHKVAHSSSTALSKNICKFIQSSSAMTSSQFPKW